MRRRYLRRDRDKLYDALRRLENAVRDVARLDGEEERARAAQELLRRVPKSPRPTQTELRKRRSRMIDRFLLWLWPHMRAMVRAW